VFDEYLQMPRVEHFFKKPGMFDSSVRDRFSPKGFRVEILLLWRSGLPQRKTWAGHALESHDGRLEAAQKQARKQGDRMSL
jgi:hypothetical protein